MCVRARACVCVWGWMDGCKNIHVCVCVCVCVFCVCVSDKVTNSMEQSPPTEAQLVKIFSTLTEHNGS
jgi:hypothetical protein